MREIKFRVRSIENKRYNYYSINNAKHMERWSNDMCNCKEPELFTGLKDKNGKEIYEGDIILTNQIVTWNDESNRRGDNQLNCFGIQNGKYDIGYYEDRDDFIVIGNIYNNPELLGVKNDDQ